MASRWLVDIVGYAVRGLIGAADWGQVRETVDSLTNSTLSGDDRRQLAADTLRSLGVLAASSLLNLAIEAAVAWAKARE